jgi:Glycosyl hydrolase family 20, domain 2/Secretion system C-terminal sorting domain
MQPKRRKTKEMRCISKRKWKESVIQGVKTNYFCVSSIPLYFVLLIMKHRIALFFLLFSSVSIVDDACYGQSLNLLTGLHPRPQVSYFLSGDSAFSLSSKTVIITQQLPSSAALRAVGYLQASLKTMIGDTLITLPESNYDFGGNVIFVGEKNWSIVQEQMTAFHWDSITHSEGYVLDIRQSNATLAGDDTSGTFNAVSTFVQLLQASKNIVPPLHIHDWPDYPIRWVFSTHNLIEPSQISALESIEDTMAAHKLNGLQQNDFKNNVYSIFEGSYPQYFYNVDSLQAYSAKTNVEIIPGVFPFGWSEGILYHDPDIAEGIPTTASYLIQSDTGIVLTDPNMILPNGGFENVSNGNFTGWSFYDGPGSVFVDSTTVHSGKYSARCTDFTTGNPSGDCRFIRSMICQPFHGYHMSVWINTQDFQGSEVQLLAIGHNGAQSTSLTATQFGVPATSNGWSQYNVVFNTLSYDSLYVYCGVWGGTAGTIWFDDFNIEDAGTTNVLRPGAELPTVSEAEKSTSYVEGKDYATVVDSIMEQNEGSYPWHTSPGFKVLPGSKINNGDTVQVHFIRPNPVANDATGDGSTMVCVSEDTLYPILQNQLSLVDAQYHAGKYFMSHDEIREMNWDTACTSRNLSPAALLAGNVKKADSILQEVHPGAERFDWSDMFDSLHNAVNDYYLVNGDLAGDWNLIPKDLTIVNWNAGYMSQSLDFFSKLGFSQITSPYYDVPNTVNMRDWRLAMDTIPNMRGMMYTTWANDYSFLTPFADYAWSAGPMIVHEPPMLFETITNGEYVPINANVYADPYNPADSLVKVTYTQYYHLNGADRVTPYKMVPDTGHLYRCTNLVQSDSGYDVTYQIQATDLEGLTRTTPRYLIFHLPAPATEAVSPVSFDIEIRIYPNPASTALNIRGMSDEQATILIEDLLGREVSRSESNSESSILDIQNIPAGIYECIITSSSGTRTALPFVKE